MDDLRIASRPAKKRLALFLDGTWNVTENNTNVWRIKSLCADRGTDNVEQLVYYDSGVGTNSGEKYLGGAIGYGLERAVKRAYQWLIDKHNDGDEIFIFGFSRGAYTARSLAGLISMNGILKTGAPLGVEELYNRYRNGPKSATIYELDADITSGKLKSPTLLEYWLLTYTVRCNIKFVGVWDTVGALGAPVFLNVRQFSRKSYAYLHTGLRQPIEHAFHAIALDEHRKKFEPTLWTKNFYTDQPPDKQSPPRPITSVEQRWFAGAHANVGGGYPSDLLAQIPLDWLMRKASGCGLTFRESVDLSQDAVKTTITDSYALFAYGFYRLFTGFRRYQRQIGIKPIEIGAMIRNIINETIDVSVFLRYQNKEVYRPKNLEKWAQAYKVDLKKIKTSVYATDPSREAP